ncbi:MAG: ferrous iron transport protein A [Clostridia bacterium]|nr:ferrous iron transport protein A [Clostridia bacterium]
MMLLTDLRIGESAKVVALNNPKKIKERLNNIGLTKGVTLTLVRVAPLGDPIQIKLRDFYLAIRLSDANKIQVEKL